MIFITGDTHSQVNRFNTEIFPEQYDMTKDDYVIVLGDFGLVWNQQEDKYEKHWLDWLDSKPFTTLFIDGNHENFDRLYSYEPEPWHGGMVHKIRNSVLHLMRGYVFSIDGKSIFTFGGAQSHDIKDGVLEPDDPRIKSWSKQWGRLFRVNHISWWKQELPSEEEKERGLINLSNNNYTVDFILSHDMPSSTLTLYNARVGRRPEPLNDLNIYLEEVKNRTSYKRWFCGHHHDNLNITSKDAVLYEQIARIS